jgi:hypothetical protein
MDPRDKVAIILALCVLIFYATGTVAGIVLRLVHPGQDIVSSVEIGALWTDITKTLIGGLLVYIAGRKFDDGPPQ